MSTSSRLFERACALSHHLRESWATRRAAAPSPRPKQRKTRSGELAARLEPRTLLTITAGEYATISSTYANFALPADMAQVNIIEITPDQLGVANLKGAITTAGTTTKPDLVVLRTTDTQNTITYASTSDGLTIDIPSANGAISIVGYGSRPLTLDAAGFNRVMSVGSTGSTTSVNLGGLVLTGGNTSGTGGGINQSYGTLRLTDVTVGANVSTQVGAGICQSSGNLYLTNVILSGNITNGYGAGLNTSGGTATLTNVTIAGNSTTTYGGGVYITSGTVTLRNTIIARNVASVWPDIYNGGTLTGANNLIGSGFGQTSLVNGVNGNLVGAKGSEIDPMLAEGNTLGVAMAPLTGSPAIDAADSSLVPAGIATDVYGASRVQGSTVNIGAVETVLPAMAGTNYVVTSLNDSIAADGDLTLREALAAANSNQAVGDAPAGSYSSPDTITFAPGLSGTILTQGQVYRITGSLNLTGPGGGQLALSAAGTGGIVDVRGALYPVTVSGLTLTGGNAANGGAISGYGVNVSLSDMLISGNTATSDGGGAFFAACTVTLNNVTLSNNTAASSGGGARFSSSWVTVTNATITGNTVKNSGGGLASSATNTFVATNLIISGNSAANYGGGVSIDTMTMTNAVISGNVARYGGGVSGPNSGTLTNVTISGNMGGGRGGGLYLTSGTPALYNTIVAKNQSPGGSDLYITGSYLSGSNNLIGDGSGQTRLVNGTNGNLVGTSATPINPMLAEGSAAGSPRLTPLTGSPAIDAGDSTRVPAGVTTDVYGSARVQGARVNIGAVESVLAGRTGVTYVVTSLGDTIAADGALTLREALAAANGNQAVGDAAAGSYSATDRITFAPGLTGSILTHGQPYQVLGSLELVGPGSGQLTLNAGGSGSVLLVTGALYSLKLSGMTLTGGNAVDGAGVNALAASLTLDDMVISGNAASGDGGGANLIGCVTKLTNVVISRNSSRYGGGINAEMGQSSLTGVTVTGNTATDGGGIFLNSNDCTFTNVTMAANTASYGGALEQYGGTSTFVNVTMSENKASSGGATEFTLSASATLTNVTIARNIGSTGGGIYIMGATVTLNNTIVARNTNGTAGDVYNDGGTLSGTYNFIGDGTNQTAFANGVNGNLVGTTASPLDPVLAEGSGYGTGLAPLSWSPVIDVGSNSLVPAGTTTDIYGAARFQGTKVNIGAVETYLYGMTATTYVVTSLDDTIAADGALTLREAVTAANTNRAAGDALAGSYSATDIITFAPGLAGTVLTHGQPFLVTGSLRLDGPGAGLITVNAGGSGTVFDIRGTLYNVKVSGLTLTGGNTGNGGAVTGNGVTLGLDRIYIAGNTATYGGAVYLYACSATLTNLVAAGNSAKYGGGIYQSSGTLTATNLTVAGNTASTSGGGLYLSSGTPTLRNSIVARNSAATAGPDIYRSGTGFAGSYDLVADGAGQTLLVNGSGGNIVGTATTPVDPQFVSMVGTDWTQWNLRLQPTSPAVNTGSNALVPFGITTDLTGGPRIIGIAVDMGAYEYNPSPTDISLSQAAIAENQPTGALVGSFTTTGTGAPFTYTLVPGPGAEDNASFTISGNQLLTAASFDYEARSSYTIRVRTTDQGGLWYEKAFTLTVTNVNEAATDLALSSSSVPENQPADTPVGTLSASDPDAGDNLTYTLVSGPGSEDNASFTISGNQLLTAAGFDFEAKGSYVLRIRVTDAGGLYVEKALTVTVADGNEAPTAIALSGSSIVENQPAGTAIGTFSSTDPDTGDSFTYTLVGGTGSDDNAAFTISGAALQAAASFDYETKSSYLIRVRTTDQGGLWFDQAFTISITDLDEIAPAVTAISINDGAIQRSMVKKLAVSFSEPVALASDALTVKLSTGAAIPNTTITLTNPSADQRTYLLTFSGAAAIGGSLPDGIYDLIASATGIQDLAGNPLTANYTQRFHRLFGDSDGNRIINSLDYARLKQTFGRAPSDPLFNSAFDYEANNLINALDLARFRQRYGMSFSY